MSTTLAQYPLNKKGIITGYNDAMLSMPSKIVEMGLLPATEFCILYQAPFNGPFYIEFGIEKSRIALRKEEAHYILVSDKKQIN